MALASATQATGATSGVFCTVLPSVLCQVGPA
jgi:hypothetical protein